VTLKLDHNLTRTGPYRLVWHPIYTGLLTAILGSAIATAEWRGVVALVLITLSFLRKIVVEERFLTAQFGDAYAPYRAEVPALVPWLS
jgi:protein-S-isoprenylcysteine O-methyltransferase Ste14